jgi:hypothetical protein
MVLSTITNGHSQPVVDVNVHFTEPIIEEVRETKNDPDYPRFLEKKGEIHHTDEGYWTSYAEIIDENGLAHTDQVIGGPFKTRQEAIDDLEEKHEKEKA